MDRVKSEPEDFDPYVLRVRGLPWSASKDDIVKFFDGCKLKNGPNGIHLTMSREGRPSGEAYVEFETPEDADKGLEKNNEHLGSRYIEVFRSKQNEMEWALRRCGLDGQEAFGDACVRLRGLPFGCSKEEIAQFFTGLEIVRNGITLPTDYQGRSTGEAYVQFASQEIAEKAMGKHKEKIGHRYIEIFKSSLQEIRNAMGMGPVRMGRSMGSNRMNPYDRPERPGAFGRGGRGRGGSVGGSFGDRGGFPERIRDTGHNVHLRGLPFRAVERDIFDFFAPLKPVAVRIKYEPSGRSSGEADAMFATHEEALRAMKKDKEKIQHRYIELFLQSEPDHFRPEGMGPFGGPPGPGQFGPRGGGGGRPFMPDSDPGYGGPGVGLDRTYGAGLPERGFGSGPARGFGGEPDRGFDGGYGGGSPVSSRGFGMSSVGGRDRDFGFNSEKPYAPSSADRGFGGQSDRGFSTGASSSDRGFGGSPVDRGYGRSTSDRSGYGTSSSDRSFVGVAGGPTRSAYSTSDRFGTADRRMDERPYGMTDTYRNGMQGNSMSAGAMRNDTGYSKDRTNESEFYGSGKLFGDNSYQSSPGQGLGMMGPTTYPGY
ncbi:heterogeneous nuclear ribonucleoprotein H2-like [Argiope bruennichi]|uniref:G-rich sequence factor 1 like protein n=1 Tax=Argiope bruennichi TaxID=94029 RepID=A0A8T0FRT7_ARGBR|nr:heterogeneous nuclear ribonucleoprotein H2-like [Argiope bruennichi]KAF8793884.1 G-rich sequence factor 1 like protein [Argiope bruennichi]